MFKETARPSVCGPTGIVKDKIVWSDVIITVSANQLGILMASMGFTFQMCGVHAWLYVVKAVCICFPLNPITELE